MIQNSSITSSHIFYSIQKSKASIKYSDKKLILKQRKVVDIILAQLDWYKTGSNLLKRYEIPIPSDNPL